jgi:hypothetical protein
MKKNVLAILTFSVFAIYPITGQDNNIDHIKVASAINQLNLSSSTMAIDLASKQVIGSPYIDKEFQAARIAGQETIYSLRYNAFNDEMEILLRENHYLLPKSFMLTIEFLNIEKSYVVLNYSSKGVPAKGFFVKLISGKKMNLYKKEQVKLHEEVPAKLGFTKYQPPELKKTKASYFIAEKGIAYALPKKKKELLKLFSEKGKVMDAYLKKNKINLKKEADLIAMVNYFNSMY